MKCPNCKSEISDDSLFCSKCGSQIHPFKKRSSSPTKTVQIPLDELTSGGIFAGRYKIIGKIGRGGMGLVYKAQDTKLKRAVALKSLPPDILIEEESKIRFIREAQAAAALNHPNICTIYEVEESGRQSYIAMEYIDGQTLKEKVGKQPIKLNEALDIVIQIAEGLRHAHEKGIVHRDIKSSNIMVSGDGQAKIMDFGLAKLVGTTVLTKKGTTLGTIAYMSPEQSQGESVDFRTDIWSLGVVLYEMLSGQLPFRGDRDQAVIYAILHEEPLPLISLRSGIPLEFERIISKCLEKDINFRYQSVSDLLADLKRLKRDWEKLKAAAVATTIIASPRRRLSKPIRIVILSAAAALILSAVAYFLLKPEKPPSQLLSELRLHHLIGGDSLAVFPSWSPDGIWIAYASNETGNLDIWKMPIDGGEAEQLTMSPNDESQPAWSPDGRHIAFFSDREGGGIFIIPSEGGNPLRLTSFGAHPSWSPDGETLAFDWYGNIYTMAYPGGEPNLIVSGTSATPFTVWTPDGEKLIYWNRTKGDIYVYSQQKAKGNALNLIPSGQEVTGLTLSKDGGLLVISLGPFGGDKNLWKVEFDPIAGQVTGKLAPFSVTPTEDIQCAFSPDGTKLAFMASQLERHLWAYPLSSATGMISGEPKRLTFKSRQNYYPACTPDGRMLVWTSHLTAQGVLCALDLETGEEIKATPEWGKGIREVGGSFAPDGKQICYSSTLRGSYEIWRLSSLQGVSMPLTKTQYPVRDTLTAWSPDGKIIAFYSNRMNNWDIWSIQADGKGQPRQLTHWESNELYPCWSPGGRHIAFKTDKEGNADIWVMNADGEDPRPYVTHQAEEGWSTWSPDGRWFYFVSNRSGSFHVWMKPTRGGEPRQVTDFKGLSLELPDFVLYAKFAVSSKTLILPLEARKGNIYIYENIDLSHK